MSGRRLFRPFKSKAQMAKRQRGSVKTARVRLTEIRLKVKRGEKLSDGDVRLMARCGPKIQAWVGFEPEVQLHQPKVTLT